MPYITVTETDYKKNNLQLLTYNSYLNVDKFIVFFSQKLFIVMPSQTVKIVRGGAMKPLHNTPGPYGT
jgi:hypothetical protein